MERDQCNVRGAGRRSIHHSTKTPRCRNASGPIVGGRRAEARRLGRYSLSHSSAHVAVAALALVVVVVLLTPRPRGPRRHRRPPLPPHPASDVRGGRLPWWVALCAVLLTYTSREDQRESRALGWGMELTGTAGVPGRISSRLASDGGQSGAVNPAVECPAFRCRGPPEKMSRQGRDGGRVLAGGSAGALRVRFPIPQEVTVRRRMPVRPRRRPF